MAIKFWQSVENPAAGEFVRKYRLLSPSSVRSSIKTLLARDFLAKHLRSIAIADKFFLLWLLRKYSN